MTSPDDQKVSSSLHKTQELKEFFDLLADLEILNSSVSSSSLEEDRAKRQAEIKQLEMEILAQKKPALLQDNFAQTTPISPPNTNQQNTKFKPSPKAKSSPSLPPLKNSFLSQGQTPSFPVSLSAEVKVSKPFETSNLSFHEEAKSEKKDNNHSYQITHEYDTMTETPCQELFLEEKIEENLSEIAQELGLNREENVIKNQEDQEIRKSSDNQELENLEQLEQILAQREEQAEIISFQVENQGILAPLLENQSKLNLARKKTTQALSPQENLPVNISQDNVDKKLQSLLAEMLLPDSQKLMGNLEEKINYLENQINDPKQLIQLLLPLIAELLNLKVLESKDDMIRAIVPIIDAIIKEKSEQDKEAMISVMANIIPGAISKQIADKPQEVIQAMAPAMGESIKEQIRLEKDSMVDALYPVIGNTISKYMGEVVKQINSKVESALSVEGIKRKVRAKMRGVSEAELILQESMPFKIQAIFLIHKGSGLVMSEAQPSNREKLEGDMLAGMLTAIRSFANECSISTENTSELTEIQYENSKIMMEVAGYCYLSVIVEGEVTKEFIKRIKNTLGIIILNYGYSNFIKEYDGDEDTIPQAVHDLLDALLNYQEVKDGQKSSTPFTLLIILMSILALITIPFGLLWYRQRVETRLENEAKIALSSTPEIAVYRLELNVEKDTVILTGKLPNELLREKAGQVAQETLPKLTVKNEIIAVDVPPDPVLIEAEVNRLTKLFNQRESVIISTVYNNNEITVKGNIRNENEAKQISQSFAEIPGIKNVFITLIPKPFAIDQRFYFNYDSAQLNQTDIIPRIKEVRQFLTKYPEMKIRIIGHTDPTGTEIRNKQLSEARAITIKNLLLAEGINPQRLIIMGIQQPPKDVFPYDPLWLGRCVRFERIM